jgi:hypothetical protein
VEVQITVNGERVSQDIDLSLDDMGMQQLCKLEKVIGADRMSVLMGARGEQLAVRTAVLPTTMRAILYVKVRDLMPDADLKLHDFDIDQDTLAVLGAVDEDEPDEAGGVVELPMAMPDGTVVQGASEHVDPTREAEAG